MSVALCTYNSGRFIETQLRSILDQDLPVDEVLIGDDGSTDGTLERIETIAAAHPRGDVVRIAFTEPSGGVAPNFSRTLAACTGELIALSDHDDVWRPDKTATLVPQLQTAKRPAMIFTDARIVDDAGAFSGEHLFASYGVASHELDAVMDGKGAEPLVRRNIVTGATAMLTRDLLDAALPIPEHYVHDEWLAFLAASLGTLLVEKQPLIDYRVHGSNQIGVPPQTLWGQVRVAMTYRRDRYETLRTRAESLRERLAAHNAAAADLALVEDKALFEAQRATMPWFWPARLPGIMRRYRSGDYARFTHRPALERWRDLVQPM
ncbi:glycosyltransferase family 2 protein [Demequina sp. TTPB684]|uniref:glycosyltransferase family 2 protein n=1 Tax=unclassified Demequina TaxID=2620311 RepID=UPI001CF49223|nr:glycosyltransferase family 2 protein [Demequina sp. TMPB413]MCB2413629.1 glycosyltransferase family 2 protein [Demequina sp. TTPB684]UPU88248.1 glycosyltransferase family 2 protein [Demequina sp. TMPB413]